MIAMMLLVVVIVIVIAIVTIAVLVSAARRLAPRSREVCCSLALLELVRL